MSENILVVPRSFIASGGELFQGFKSGVDSVLNERISSGSFFMKRDQAEHDSRFKQLITYLILRYQKQIFVYRRVEATNEKRLLNLYSFGLGGHMNPTNAQGLQKMISRNLNRELREEIYLGRPYSYHFLGFINDDSTEVGKYHLGLVFLVSCSSAEVSVREINKLTGNLVPLADLNKYESGLESWSALLLPDLQRSLS